MRRGLVVNMGVCGIFAILLAGADVTARSLSDNSLRKPVTKKVNSSETLEHILSAAPCNNREHLYAFLVSGTPNTPWGVLFHHYTLALAYCTLKDHGYLDDHIFSFFTQMCGDSSNFYNDSLPPIWTIPDSLADLDQDGDRDITNLPRRDSLDIYLNVLDNTLTQDDQLLIFIFSHGNMNFINLYDTPDINPDWLFDWINSINPGRVIIILQACYSGSFIDNFQNDCTVPGIIMTCDTTEPYEFDDGYYVFGNRNRSYFQFPFNVFSVFRCTFPGSQGPWTTSGINPGLIFDDRNWTVPAYGWLSGSIWDWDLDGNGWISCYEAFAWADTDEIASTRDNDPQIASNPSYIMYRSGVLLPNLTYREDAGWDFYAVIPRNSGDATPNSCHLPNMLLGGYPSTYLNYRIENNGAIGTERNYIHSQLHLDGEFLNTYTNMGYLEPDSIVYKINLGPYTVRGGRHTLKLIVDAGNNHLELDPNDNEVEYQFVWTPQFLTAGDYFYRRAAPPEKGDLEYPNCDGFSFFSSFPSNAWAGVSTLPLSNNALYQMRLYNDYENSVTGFQTCLFASHNYPGGISNFILVNAREAPSDTYNIGVTKFSGGDKDYYINMTYEKGTIAIPDTTDTFSLSGIMNIHDIWIAEAGSYKFTVHVISGSVDIGISLYPDNLPYMGKSNFLPGAYADSNGNGEDESFTVTLQDFKYYAFVVWRVGYSDSVGHNDYVIRIDKQEVGISEELFSPNEDNRKGFPKVFPNPFNTKAMISYYLQKPSEVCVSIYSVTGELVIQLVKKSQSAGCHSVIWDGTDKSGKKISSGIYFCQLKVDDNFLHTQKLLLLR